MSVRYDDAIFVDRRRGSLFVGEPAGQAPSVQHRARLTDIHEIGVMLNSIDAFGGYPITRYALQILAHVFLRSKELQLAKWVDVDLEKSIWTIPAANMKRRREHVVPLSRQVKEMLQQLHDWTGHGEYLFMSPHSRSC